MSSPHNACDSATRASLIAGLRRGDARAWHQMVDLYAPLVHHWCQRSGVDIDAAADVMQEVFAAVAGHITQFGYRQRDDSFRGWLWTVTRNKALDYHRHRRRQVQSLGGSTALHRFSKHPDEASLPQDEPTGPAEISGLVHRALEQVRGEFQPRTWTAFWRSCVDGLPSVVVAAELDLTPAGVRQARSRVLRRLRQQLGELID